jgi:hypothetical protein
VGGGGEVHDKFDLGCMEKCLTEEGGRRWRLPDGRARRRGERGRGRCCTSSWWEEKRARGKNSMGRAPMFF